MKTTDFLIKLISEQENDKLFQKAIARLYRKYESKLLTEIISPASPATASTKSIRPADFIMKIIELAGVFNKLKGIRRQGQTIRTNEASFTTVFKEKVPGLKPGVYVKMWGGLRLNPTVGGRYQEIGDFYIGLYKNIDSFIIIYGPTYRKPKMSEKIRGIFSGDLEAQQGQPPATMSRGKIVQKIMEKPHYVNTAENLIKVIRAIQDYLSNQVETPEMQELLDA